MGYDATRAKEYYRTNFPNSSLKFRWLNGKATKVLGIGNTKQQFQKIYRRHKTNPDPSELIRLGLSKPALPTDCLLSEGVRLSGT